MAHLVLIACLMAAPHTCQEIPLPDVKFDDVVSCTHLAEGKADEWVTAHQDYSVIGTKCVKDDLKPAKPPAN